MYNLYTPCTLDVECYNLNANFILAKLLRLITNLKIVL